MRTDWRRIIRFLMDHRRLTLSGKFLRDSLSYSDGCTPAGLVNPKTGEPVEDFSRPPTDAVFEAGSFYLISYEWGVTYSGMLFGGRGDIRSPFCRLHRQTPRIARGSFSALSGADQGGSEDQDCNEFRRDSQISMIPVPCAPP